MLEPRQILFGPPLATVGRVGQNHIKAPRRTDIGELTTPMKNGLESGWRIVRGRLPTMPGDRVSATKVGL